MPRRRHASQQQNTALPSGAGGRAELIQAAARLIAEAGLDYGSAKRKAARQLGLPEAFPLPANDVLEAAVQEYQSIFQADEQAERIFALRHCAVQLMRRLAAFSPRLTGSVLSGSASRHARIDLLLFPDSAKEVEMFLLNCDLPFHHLRPANAKTEAVLAIDDAAMPANLIIMAPNQQRMAQKRGNGRSCARAKLAEVEALCRAEDAAEAKQALGESG